MLVASSSNYDLWTIFLVAMLNQQGVNQLLGSQRTWAFFSSGNEGPAEIGPGSFGKTKSVFSSKKISCYSITVW